MAEISAQMVKELRERTGAGMMDCKKALQDTNGDFEKAIEELRKKGIAKAAKREGREANQGVVESYIHAGSRLGVLVEINCETDFVANTDEMKNFARNVAMHIAASNPLAVKREDLNQELVAKEMNILKEQTLAEGKPANIIDKIVTGRMEKFFSEVALLEQVYVKDPDKTIKSLLTETIAKVGENVEIRRFARFAVGS
jgi:elongation factor Ts